MTTHYHHHARSRQEAIEKLQAETGLPAWAKELVLRQLGELVANDTGQSVLVNASVSQGPNGVSINAGVRYSAPLA